MRWLVDECVDARINAWLRSHGHDVLSVLETMRSARDRDIANAATGAHRLVLTEDKDFGELAIRHALIFPGLVLIRLADESVNRKIARLEDAIAVRGEMLFGHYTVIDDRRVRVRAL